MRPSRKSYGENNHGDSGPSSGRRSARNGQSEAAWPKRSGSGMDGPEEHERGVGEEDLKAQLGCKCRNSRCLKLYCVCFAARKFCDGCACVDCGNTEENVSEVHKRRHKVNVKNPHAFQDKKNPIVAKGCNCLKSRCLKGYCECFAAGRGCMPICCCKDCENVYGVRPGIDEAMLSRGKAGFLTRPMRTLAAFSEDQMLTDAPSTRHGRLSTFCEPGQPGDESDDDTGDPGSDDSSEPPHPSLLNLVKAAEEIERSQPAERTPDSPSQGHTCTAPGPSDIPHAVEAVAAAQAHSSASPSPHAVAQPSKQVPNISPASGGIERKAPPAAERQPSPPPATSGPVQSNKEEDFAEEYAVQDMHRRLLQQAKHTKLPLPGGLDFAFLDRVLQERGPGSFGWPDLHRRTAHPVNPPVITAPKKQEKTKPVAVVATEPPPPVKAVPRKAQKALHVTVCRDGGGGSPVVPLVMSPDVRGAATVPLRHRDNTPLNGYAERDAGAALGANGSGIGGRDGGSQLKRSGGQTIADAGTGARGALNGSSSAAAPDFTELDAGRGPQPRREQSAQALGALAGYATLTHAAAPSGVPALGAPPGPRNGATPMEGEAGPAAASAGGKVFAWLVSSSPHISSPGAAFASVPVQITGDSAAAGNDQTTLLVPCQALPPESADPSGVQLRFHRVEMQEADLRALCAPGLPAAARTLPASAMPAPAPCGKLSKLAPEDLPQSSGGGSGDADLPEECGRGAGSSRTRSNSGAHAGLDALAGTSGAAADGAREGADIRGADPAEGEGANKPRFRSARLQKRAEREGPRLTQVAFDDTLPPAKRRRECNEPIGPERSDFMSGLLGKRVCVPKRARSAVTASQKSGQAGAEDSGAQGALSTGAHGTQRREQDNAPGTSRAGCVPSEPPSLPHSKPVSPRPADGGLESPDGDPGTSGRMHSLFTGGENNEEEEYAVMGLLRLCEAS